MEGYLRGAGKPPGSRHDSPDELKMTYTDIDRHIYG